MLVIHKSHLQLSGLRAKADEYRKRALDIQKSLTSPGASSATPEAPSSDKTEQVQRAYFLLSEALDLDEEGKVEDALEAYTQAVELCIEAKGEASEANKKKLSRVATQALDRAEVLKKNLNKPTSQQPKAVQQTVPQSQVKTGFDLLHIGEKDDAAVASKSSSARVTGAVGLTEEEKKVLAVTSNINSREVWL